MLFRPQTEGSDLITLFLLSKEQGVDLQVIMDESLSLIFGGLDTTSKLLVY